MKLFKLNKKVIFLILLIPIFLLVGCDLKTEEEESMEEKVNQEMEYVDTKLLTMLNSLNNINVKNYSVVTQKSNNTSSSSQKEGQGTSEENEENGTDGSNQMRKWK